MGTRANIGFVEGGKFYAMYSHFDSYPDNVIPQLVTALYEKGYDWYVNEIKTNGLTGGARGLSYDGDSLAEYYDDVESSGDWTKDLMVDNLDQQYAYKVYRDFKIDVYSWGDLIDTVDVSHKGVIKLVFQDEEELGEIFGNNFLNNFLSNLLDSFGA